MTDRAGLKLSGLFVTVVYSSVTVADRAVLKPVGVDIPFDLGISISKNCKIYQVFLFLRPARSFFDQAIGSPQAYIPALTAVWIHYSKFAFECEFWGSDIGPSLLFSWKRIPEMLLKSS